MRDANGKSVETFAYNGTTYVPLRAVSQSLGKDVSYDGKTQRVYIGTNPNTTKYLMDVCPPYQVSNTYQVRSLANTSDKNRTMGGRQYGNGIYMYTGYGTENNALFNLDGQYDSLTATVGHVDGSGSVDVSLFFYVDDVLKASFTIGSEDLPKDVIIPLDGGLQLKVLAKASGGSSSVNVANMIVK